MYTNIMDLFLNISLQQSSYNQLYKQKFEKSTWLKNILQY